MATKNKNPNVPGDKHPEYVKHEDQVNRVNNVYDGVDTAKRYLQQYNQEENKDYKERQDIATLDNFVFRTVDDMKNIIFRKPLDETNLTNTNLITWSKTINFEDNLNEFGKKVLGNRVKDGFTYILVDSINYDKDQVQNKAQQDALGIRPYFVNIPRKNILSWKKNAAGEYTQIVIAEQYEIETEFNVAMGDQIKVWKDDGTVQIWRDDEKYGEEIETGSTKIPLIKVGDDDIPPLYDLAKINITHMNRDSEVSNYSRVGGAAFLAVFGDLEDGDNKPATLGINKGLKFRDKTTSDVKWIEMEGKNYEMLKDRILYHEDQMQRIAVSFTTEGGEAKTATQINKESMTGESKATDYATELEEGLNSAIQMLNEYLTTDISVENVVETNKDFDSAILTPEMVTSYRTDYLAGIISWEKLMEYLIAGEYFKNMTTKEIEEEKQRLLDDPIGGFDTEDDE